MSEPSLCHKDGGEPHDGDCPHGDEEGLELMRSDIRNVSVDFVRCCIQYKGKKILTNAMS